MSKFKRYLITSALPYANGPIHIGHLAGAYLPADIYARYLRLKGEAVAFVCGSDEHGVPITLRAKKEGITPQQVVDKYHELNKKAFADFGISFDIYHRTSDKLHHQTAADFFKVLYDKGVFKEIESEQFYDEEAKQFLADRYIVGTCPKCGNENAYGDQCEKCGSTLSPDELINPRSALSGKSPIKKKTKHWYLPLDKIQEEWLEKWVNSHQSSVGSLQPDNEIESWKSNVYGQCKSWLDQGLQPRAVTRDLDWGVPVPVKGAEGKVLYVWFDAPIGYISATKALFQQLETQPALPAGRLESSSWEDYWKKNDTKLVHFIGKDNIVFHTLIFPAMLKAHGDFILPENIPANEFMNLEGDKISTSRNWAVWLHEYLEESPDKQDVLRYCLVSNMPETKDSEFTWKDFKDKNNNELVAILANFINRVLILVNKYYGRDIKRSIIKLNSSKERADFTFDESISKSIQEYQKNIENYSFRAAMKSAFEIARSGNEYLSSTEPWKLVKNSTQRLEIVLFSCLEAIGKLTILLNPFLPFASKRICKMLNLEPEIYLKWSNIDKIILSHETTHTLGQPEHLFSKIEDDVIEKQIQKLHQTKKDNQPKSNFKPMIQFEDFQKMDIRVGTIKKAEKVTGADKLLKLEVDLGVEIRTIVSGIAEHYTPEAVIGQQVSVLTNLVPRKIRGVESKGMILMAEDKDGKLSFVSPKDTVQSGSEIR